MRRAIIDVAERHDLTILADEVYGELGYDGPVPLLSTLDPDAPIISFSSLSKAYLAPGWRTGWLVVGATPRLDDALAAIKKMADGRLCSPGPMQHAVAPALLGDRSHQPAFRAALAERARVTTEMLNAIPGMRCVAPRGAFYAMPQLTLPPGRTDEHYVLSLLRETGILCVYGSGFGVAPEMGTFRIVFLAQPSDLRTIYADIGAFTANYPRAGRLDARAAGGPHVPVVSRRAPPHFGAAHAALVYTAIALWATWPLARGLTRDVAWDLGDPVLVIWALAWNCTQLLAILGGDLSRIGTYFDANIFAPGPNTLAYSEHFVAQAVQVLPVYAITGNAVLCYNLLYLSTFVLSGLGTFLFVRELTGSRAAAFTAGLLFAFAPYRFPQSSHLQVLSSQWMPLALYAFRRYFDTGRPRALLGAVGGARRAEPVVRLLHALLLAVCRRLRAGRDRGAGPVAVGGGVAAAHRRRRSRCSPSRCRSSCPISRCAERSRPRARSPR